MSSIPIAEQGRMTSPQEESRAANDQERPLRSVYVVDDEIQVLEVMQLQLAAADYRVRTFGNARSFLAAVDTLDPGVVITDQKMPEMNGLELQEQLQARARSVSDYFAFRLSRDAGRSTSDEAGGSDCPRQTLQQGSPL